MNSKASISALTFKDLTAPADIKFHRKPSMAYKYPKYDEVKPGQYFAEVKVIEEVTTRKGDLAVDICYDIVNHFQHARYIQGLTNVQPKHFKIKERIVRNSTREDNFIESLCGFYDLDDNVTDKDYIGLTEIFSIGYFGGDDCIGTIHDRFGFDEENLIDWYREKYCSDEE